MSTEYLYYHTFAYRVAYIMSINKEHYSYGSLFIKSYNYISSPELKIVTKVYLRNKKRYFNWEGIIKDQHFRLSCDFGSLNSFMLLVRLFRASGMMFI